MDSKGNFGKVYSRDMAWAASRYTEVQLEPHLRRAFPGYRFQDTVDLVDNYDGTMQEPSLLPTTFPNVLVSANQGIAVGMASNLCVSIWRRSATPRWPGSNTRTATCSPF